MSSTYQLTPHPVGSKREFWALTWPLMIGLFSTSFMFFIDRLFLAKFDPLALNASASGGMAYWMFLVVPVGISAIAEVLAGRLHGEGRFKEVGKATMQMVWFGLLLTPIFLLIARFFPPLLFSGTGNEEMETAYFQSLTYFAPVQCIAIALSGFFIGIGKVKMVTAAALIGNLVNVVLDYMMIFGYGPIPSMGVTGAAVATGISQVVQVLFLGAIFWNATYRTQFGTKDIGYDHTYFWEGLKIGAPAGFGRFIETLAHFLFLRIVIMVGADQMALVTMIQSLYILLIFIVEAESKGAGAIVSNLLGAKQFKPLNQVLRSSYILHFSYFILITVLSLIFYKEVFELFKSDEAFLADAIYQATFFKALAFMCLFFLLDGLVWILMGYLTASGDTKFLFMVSLIVHWVAYIIPTYWLVGVMRGDAGDAWAVIACMNVINLTMYLYRYTSGKWLRAFHQLKPVEA
ncbi:MAG: MATE family efflux transporter [Parachlamydiaceae bacterium]